MADKKQFIDPNEFWKQLNKSRYDFFTYPDGRCGYSLGTISDVLWRTKSVDVVHGRWECEHETWGQLQCSICKKQALLEKANGDVGTILLYVTSNYCPNCGAKMDGDGNG